MEFVIKIVVCFFAGLGAGLGTGGVFVRPRGAVCVAVFHLAESITGRRRFVNPGARHAGREGDYTVTTLSNFAMLTSPW